MPLFAAAMGYVPKIYKDKSVTQARQIGISVDRISQHIQISHLTTYCVCVCIQRHLLSGGGLIFLRKRYQCVTFPYWTDEWKGNHL